MRPASRAARRRLLVAGLAATLCSAGLLTTVPASAALTDPCLVAPPAGAIMGDPAAREGDEELHGTELDDVIYGFGGDDVILGYGGNDTICGGDGHDGVNGGPGNDLLGGGAGVDLIAGHDGDDTIFGGTEQDGVYGGNGADNVTVSGDSGAVDYVGLGPGVDTSTAAAGDEVHDPIQAGDPCPTTAFYTRRMGAYNPDRLGNTGVDDGCQTVKGEVRHRGQSGDGDLTYNIWCTTTGAPCYGGRWFHVEFMPRDNPHYAGGGDSIVGTVIRVRGVHIYDKNHKTGGLGGCENPACTTEGIREIHPIYAVDKDNNGTWETYLGPRYAGSPWKINPDKSTDNMRYCWDELGARCTGFDGGTFATTTVAPAPL